MADAVYVEKKRGRPKVLSSSAKKRKKQQLDCVRGKSRISIGSEIDRWMTVQGRLGLKTHTEVAKVLLDRYESTELPTSKENVKPMVTTTTPACKATEFNSITAGGRVVQWASGMSGIEMLSDTEKECPARPLQTSGSFLNPFDLTIEVSEEEALKEIQDDDDDGDYEPSMNITLKPVNADTVEEVCYAEAEFGDHIDGDSWYEDTSVSEADVSAGPGLLRVLSPADQAVVTEDDTFLCFLGQLLTLAQAKIPQRCCNNDCRQPVGISHETIGSALYLKWNCDAGHSVYTWCSQPILNRRLHSGDLLVSAAILMSGNNYAKVALLARFLRLHLVSMTVFHRIQRHYLVPAIDQFWEEHQRAILDRLKDEQLVLLGDGRMDSPGHSAQYCSYTMMENSSKEIVSLVTMDKRHTDRKSANLEKACFSKSMAQMTQKRLQVKEIVTDAHMQITALMKRSHPRIKHSYDIWHVTKNLSKKIAKAGQEKSCRALLKWSKHITNHFWHAAQKADSYKEFMGIWSGVLHHVVNEHEWLFNYGSGSNCCSHGPLTQEREVEWLEKGSKAHQALVKIVLDRRLQNNVSYYLNFRSTAELESFQNLILMYSAKRFAYSPPVYRARNLLAALDYNQHVNRAVRLNQDGSISYHRVFNKKSGRWSVTEVKEDKDYSYIPELMKAVVERRLNDPRGMQGRMVLDAEDPRRISRTLALEPPPETSKLVEEKKSRLK